MSSLRSPLWCLFCPCVLPCVAVVSFYFQWFAVVLPVPCLFCCAFGFCSMLRLPLLPFLLRLPLRMIACVCRFHVTLLYVALDFTLLSLTLFSLYVELTVWRNTLLSRARTEQRRRGLYKQQPGSCGHTERQLGGTHTTTPPHPTPPHPPPPLLSPLPRTSPPPSPTPLPAHRHTQHHPPPPPRFRLVCVPLLWCDLFGRNPSGRPHG